MEDCANPLFAEWLKEWMNTAQMHGSKGALVYKKAYQSMKACTFSLQHASEAEQLNGLGPKLCKRLAEKHIEYCTENRLPLPQKPQKKALTTSRSAQQANGESSALAAVEPSEQPPAKRQRKQKEYVPQLRSGAYAIIMALGELSRDGSQGLTKKDLIARAQPYCDSSFTIPSDTSKFYTAWKSVETLEKKELVYTRGHPTKRYCLTDEGWIIADRMRSSEGLKLTSDQPALVKASKSKRMPSEGQTLMDHQQVGSSVAAIQTLELDSDSGNEAQEVLTPKLTTIEASGHPANATLPASVKDAEPIVLQPGTFEVMLLLDTREVRTKGDRDYMSTELKKTGISVEVRTLPIGDALWIAKLKSPYVAAFRSQNQDDENEGSDEIVLEHVVERKRLDDLMSSIRDGRFHEQKFRLKKSGMRHVTYLVESYSISADQLETYGLSLESAIASMQIVDNIFVKQTSKMDETIKYLSKMTQSLKRTYEQRELLVLRSTSLDVATHYKTLHRLQEESPSNSYCVTFSAFSSLCDKSDSLTLRDLYLKMLMCMRGVTGDKAIEVQKIWPTPNALIEAYNALGTDKAAKDKMISNRLGKAISRKQVADTLSAKIAEVWAC